MDKLMNDGQKVIDATTNGDKKAMQEKLDGECIVSLRLVCISMYLKLLVLNL